MSSIKSMGLYRNVDRVESDLAAAGFGPADKVTVDDLSAFDQYHYEGTDAVDDAIGALEATSNSHILDIGSGLGGPARFIAARTGAHVTALELQSDLDQTGALLTKRCGLTDRVTHLQGDVLEGVAGADRYDGIVSMLCFLHIPDRRRLFTNCADALRLQGRIFIDDYVKLGNFTAAEQQHLSDTVYCTCLPDRTAYQHDLALAGFDNISVVDKTADWSVFVVDRLNVFRDNMSELLHLYGEETVEALGHFYSTVAELFLGGNLGGIRITASLEQRI